MQNASSDKLTILVLTYNRYDRLMRLLRYVDSIKPAYKIHILDSSSDALTDDKQEFQRIIERNGISWDHYDPKTHPIAKTRMGLEMVKTPYVVLWADDDFMIPSAFAPGIKFLEGNPDYSLVHGQSAILTIESEQNHKSIKNLGNYRQLAVEDGSAAQRLVRHLNEYFVTCYSIHRTANIKKNTDLSLHYDFAYGFGELVPSCLSVIQGKVKKLKQLYMVREAHSGMDSWNDSGKAIDLFDWVVKDNFSENCEKFSRCLSEELVRQDGISKEQAQEVVKQAFWSYLAKGIPLKYHGRYGKLKSLRKTLRRVPFIADYLIPVLQKAKAKIRPNEISLSTLLSSSSQYHDDFMPVYQALTNGSNLEKN